MNLTEKEAFRLGFLSRCAEEKLTGAALNDRIKCADGGLNPADWLLPLGAGAAGLYLASRTPYVGPVVGLLPAAGLAGGAGLGYMAAKMTEPDIEPADIKAQELADTYRVYAHRARANRQAKKYRQSRGTV
jgi:hypothetical protein